VDLLVAGVGNVLRGDDGFGVVVANRLKADLLPTGVRVVEVGIGGIHLVHELYERPDALIVLDAMELERVPGTVAVVRPHILDVAALPLARRHDELADMHYATPERALMLARALSLLPEVVWVVGCQPVDTDQLGEGVSAAVASAVPVAAAEVRRLATELGIQWS
jgi:hydrogenase maturation protease